MQSIDVVILYGNPRKRGNSTIIAKKLKQGLLAGNIKVYDFYLHGMVIKPCTITPENIVFLTRFSGVIV